MACWERGHMPDSNLDHLNQGKQPLYTGYTDDHTAIYASAPYTRFYLVKDHKKELKCTVATLGLGRHTLQKTT